MLEKQIAQQPDALDRLINAIRSFRGNTHLMAFLCDEHIRTHPEVTWLHGYRPQCPDLHLLENLLTADKMHYAFPECAGILRPAPAELVEIAQTAERVAGRVAGRSAVLSFDVTAGRVVVDFAAISALAQEGVEVAVRFDFDNAGENGVVLPKVEYLTEHFCL
ncbi:hypothetical protein A9R05_41785 (plasmid) [Burkholderia sp. KK1]|uniref:Uncharacterized protein n=1 Tax=Burkholderia sp. M701 TaxID=326454 RepID=V5YN46_9BURK|nr:hypothetical protein [Burkholderia sp. M701]AQH05559.1 hypothetical protein A9R05_41785 [Burkholderia sp. KK1]BAO18827.1 hypothetical protein [Burkholderia sp. M701]